jgi:hypothetical protein
VLETCVSKIRQWLLVKKNSYLDAVHFFEGVDVSPVHTEIAVPAKQNMIPGCWWRRHWQIAGISFSAISDEELAELDKQTYEETKGDEDDRGGVILEESALIKV